MIEGKPGSLAGLSFLVLLFEIGLSRSIPVGTLATRTHLGVVIFVAGEPFVAAPLAAKTPKLNLRHAW
jgi:hypothetical protein